MRVGDKVLRKLCYGTEGGGDLPPVGGTVVYIHPARRFYVAEFYMGRLGSIRESFPILGRVTAPLYGEEAEPLGSGARTRGYTIRSAVPRASAYAPHLRPGSGRHYTKKAAATAGKKDMR